MPEGCFVVAIDGTLGSGKSTVARLVGAELGLPVVDTGATYRLVGLRASETAVPLEDGSRVAEVARRVASCTTMGPDGRLVSDGRVVGKEIRTPDVSHAASIVAAHPEVREAIVALQRTLVPSEGAVVEGRDIGTVVFPHAGMKVFLDARPEVRAQRRRDARPGEGIDEMDALKERDRRDATRRVGAMRPAPDAVVIDTSDLTPQQVAARIVVLTRAARAGRGVVVPPRSGLVYRTIRGLLAGLLRGPFRLEVRGGEHVPAAGGAILAPNHRSLIDIAVVGVLTRRPVRFMAKEELFGSTIAARLLEHLGTFPVRRGKPDRASLRTALELLDGGELLGLFPEGTRRPHHRFEELEEGLAYVALKSGAPVVPVALSGTESVFPKGSRLPRPVKIRARIGAPFVLGGPTAGLLRRSRVREATAEARHRLRVVMEELEPEPRAPVLDLER